MAYPLCPPLFCVPTMTLSRTDLAELAVFAAVARHRSFKQGRPRGSGSPPRPWVMPSRAGGRLAVRLLNRSTGPWCRPAKRANGCAGPGGQPLGQLEAALAELTRHAGEPVGRLGLCPRAAIREVLAPVLIDYLVSYPHAGWRWRNWAMPASSRDGYDAALFYGDLLPLEMIPVPLGQQQHSAVGSPRLSGAAWHPATPSDLRQHDCIGYRLTPHHHYRWAFAAEGSCWRSK